MKWVHRLTNLDTENKTADCANCGKVEIKLKNNGKLNGKEKRLVWKCRKSLRIHRLGKRRREIPLVCSKCGFIAKHRCQMDWHHIDGDHSNNDPSNRQVLCANCHRLVSVEQKHWLPKVKVA